MNEKYYTPKIEEFHVGFEYEMKYFSDSYWQKKVIGTNIFEVNWSGQDQEEYHMESLIESNKVRVKCLDRQDIEELGWVFIHDGGAFEEFFLDGWNLSFFLKHIEITNYTKYESASFIGVIRNKSELKKVMEMVGITLTTPAS